MIHLNQITSTYPPYRIPLVMYLNPPPIATSLHVSWTAATQTPHYPLEMKLYNDHTLDNYRSRRPGPSLWRPVLQLLYTSSSAPSSHTYPHFYTYRETNINTSTDPTPDPEPDTTTVLDPLSLPGADPLPNPPTNFHPINRPECVPDPYADDDTTPVPKSGTINHPFPHTGPCRY